MPCLHHDDNQSCNARLDAIAREKAVGIDTIEIWFADEARIGQKNNHLSARLVIPTNITILPMPPKSPELNPVENIWQFMRDNWLSNRVFKSYDDLVDHCCEAWNKLVDQPWRIMSIGLRQWAHGSSSKGTGIRCLVRAMAIPDAVELTVSHSHRKPRLSAEYLLNCPRQRLGSRCACLLFEGGAELLDDRTPVCGCCRSLL